MNVVYLKKRYMRQFVSLLFFLTFFHANAQELISSAGENAQNSSGSLTFAIGEIISQTGNEGNLFLTQGFCQPPPETANLAELILNQVSTSPNPFSGYIMIRGNIPMQSFQFSLCSIDGHEVLRSEEVNELPYQLILPNLAEGSYLLYIHSSNELKLVVSHLIHIAP